MGNLGATTHGSTIVIPAPLFDPAATLAAVAGERCTSLYGVPTMFIAELGVEGFAGYDLSSLRTGIMAGSPCPVEVMKRVITRDAHGRGGHLLRDDRDLAGVDPDPPRRRPGAAHRHRRPGHAARGGQGDRSGDRGWSCRCGEPGELCTRGYSVMLGYWDDPEKTAEAIDPAGWMHTGDLAVMRDDGYVNIVGRIKDLVIRGGENVYPREVEEFLYTHPDIEDVAVIGVPDERYGEEIMAWIRLRPGGSAAGRGRGAGLLRRADRPPEDPSLRAHRRRVPDDRDRQGAQGGDAPGEHRGAGAAAAAGIDTA